MSRLITCVLFAALWLPATVVAQTSTQAPAAQPFVAGPAKLAWIDLDAAIINCDQGKKEFEELQKFMDAKRGEMDALKKEVDGLQNQINVQGAKLTDEALDELQEQFEVKNTHLQRFQQDAQKELDSRKQRIGNNIGKKMMPIISKVAKEKGLTAVLIVNPNRDAYIDTSLLLTEEVVKTYNQTYAAAAAPAKKP